MRIAPSVSTRAKVFLILCGIFLLTSTFAQSNVNIRIMAANLNGNTQSYQPFALRILQGTVPDVVAIQEFNYTSTNNLGVNTAAALREMIDTAFGTNFVYYREPFAGSGDIPNGIISRYPIIASGSWADTVQSSPNRGFAWAQIGLPGTNALYIVSVHLLTTSASNRAAEAANLKTLMQANFPANAWIVVAGDFNADPRTEACVTTFNGYLTDAPIPADKNGNSNTSAARSTPHDYVLPSLTLTNFETATVFSTLVSPSGLVFDSRVYTAGELAIFNPVQAADSGLAQHMAVMKDFSIPVGVATNPPIIVAQPPGQTNAVGANISFAVTATGSGTLNYQWRFNSANISGATANPFALANAQLANSGNYSVVITNSFGSVTSSVAALLLTNAPPVIVAQPPGQSILAGQNATFTVSATGTAPLNYQWLFNGANISGATTNPFVLAGVQNINAGNYSVIITNSVGSVTSSVATLNIVFTNPTVFAQWNFNSTPPDGSSSTGTNVASVGSGTASLVGGVVINGSGFAGGDAILDPAGSTDNTAWNTTTYPAATVGNKTAGAQFAVSTTGKQNITVSWSQQSSKTGGKYFRLQYSTNSGASFADFSTSATMTLGTNFYAFTNNLSSAPGVNNNANFLFRIVGEFESTAIGTASANYVAAQPGSTYANTGTTRFDMVSVSGISYVVATSATLSPLAFTNGQFSFTVSGATGASYIVQTATNLFSGNWTPLATNVAPFTLTVTNLIEPQRFYRAVAQ